MLDPSLLAELIDEVEASPPQAPGDNLKRLQDLGNEAIQLEQEIDDLELEASRKKMRLQSLLNRDMVDLLDECEVPDITIRNRQFLVSTYCKASIKTDSSTAEEAYNWLEDNDAGDLIKRDVIVSFPKEFQDEAEALVTFVKERYQMADVLLKRGVPWARLTSWVKEQRKLGEVLPLELLGASVGRIVTIKKVKSK